ncbi:hypothetical protein C8J57DRAFT_1726050 [Mycena rebaudengoi]|nr:hypothetical protein C8J57DRAFT_1729494 [Mycena rebaudengoi]KAJ7243272.1 hypothetical protein C8J57DRAFT_1726050 [Mycena rebaudengoi]
MSSHESSQYHPVAMSSTAWDGEEASELTKKKSLSPARRLIPRIIVTSFFLLILVAVILTGVRFKKKVKKTEDKHSLDRLKSLDAPPNMPDPDPDSLVVGITILMKNFDPGSSILFFDMQAFLASLSSPDPPAGDDAMSVCVYAVDPAGLKTPLSLPLNYGNKRDISSVSYNTTVDGSITDFPFDVYSGSLVMGALVLTNSTDNSTVSCDNGFDVVDNINVGYLPVYFQIGQDLDDFSAHTALQQLPENDPLAYFGNGSVLLSITVPRREVVRFFAVLMFIATWLLTIGVLLATAQVLMNDCQSRFDIIATCTGLLFALPGLRSATPGIPTTPTVSDAVGYFWNIALLALSTFVLMCHAIWHMRDEKVEKGAAKSKDE